MKTIRAVCTDIDGTLLDANRQLANRTIAAFKRIPENVPVVLASSRMPSAMRHLQAELNILHHPLICFNGGYVIFYPDGGSNPTVIDTVQIPLEVCQSIATFVGGTGIHLSLYSDDHWYAPQLDVYAEKEVRVTKVQPAILGFDAVMQRWRATSIGAHKVMCMGVVSEIEVLYQTLQHALADKIHIYRSSPTYIEIAPRAISKASALSLVMSTCYSIPMNDVMAFGDNYNDVEMIRDVGFGVAVANAREEVKAVAKEITLGNKEDGVAIVLEKYF